MVSYLVHHVTVLQNETDIITKCESYFITKYDQNLLPKYINFLLQNATVLLQNATVIAKCDDFITKFDSHYKILRLLQNYYKMVGTS